MNQILLLAGIVIILSVFLHKLSTKIGMPVLLAFLLLGMLFGVDGIFKIHFENFALSEALCSFGLLFIMFSGGFETSWKEARYVAKEAILLSSFGGVLTSLFVAFFVSKVFAVDFSWGLLSTPSRLGSVMLEAAGIFLFPTFLARLLVVFFLMHFFPASRNKKLLLSFAGLRGAASIVFAILAVGKGTIG